MSLPVRFPQENLKMMVTNFLFCHQARRLVSAVVRFKTTSKELVSSSASAVFRFLPLEVVGLGGAEDDGLIA